jgi:hypothetical protein
MRETQRFTLGTYILIRKYVVDFSHIPLCPLDRSRKIAGPLPLLTVTIQSILRPERAFNFNKISSVGVF